MSKIKRALFAAFLLLPLSACSAVPPLSTLPPRATSTPGTTSLSANTPLGGGGVDFAAIAESLSPCVVSISTRSHVLSAQGVVPLQGIGTGVIVHESGLVVTNDHVAGNKESVHVVFQDGSSLPGETLWSDPVLDLAIVKIQSNDRFPAATMGTSESARVGDPVLAIGTPLTLQFQHTVTHGVISAKHRALEVGSDTGMPNIMEDLLQTDVAINPGNSGGPLIDGAGNVIGINTIKVTEAAGLGFSIPIDVARPIVDHFIREGLFTSPYIGVFALDQTMARFYDANITLPNALYTLQVDEYGPAYAAGVRQGDWITHVDGAVLSSMIQLRIAMYQKNVGDQIVLRLYRDGKEEDVTVTLTASPTAK